MSNLLQSIMKGVKKNERKVFTIGTVIGTTLVGVSVWVQKDKIKAKFKETREARSSDDPEVRKKGNIDLAKGVAKESLPIAASFVLASGCSIGNYLSAERSINAGMSVLSSMAGISLSDDLKPEDIKSAFMFEKPYDDGEQGTYHDVQNQAAYVSARDLLIRDAIANGYQLAYLETTGDYIFFKGNVDDLIQRANNEIDKDWYTSGNGEHRCISFAHIKEAFGIMDIAATDQLGGFASNTIHDEAPTFYKRRPYGTHSINSVMWEIYTPADCVAGYRDLFE